MELLDANPWLKTTKLVVKPDMLFGKRGKHDLVGLNLDFPGVEAFIKARMGKVVDMDGCVGGINTFVVEPFVPHKQEYYLCIQVCHDTSQPAIALMKSTRLALHVFFVPELTGVVSSQQFTCLQRQAAHSHSLLVAMMETCWPAFLQEQCALPERFEEAEALYRCVVQSNRLGNDISFSEAGGVEIEENWDKVKKITLAVEEEATNDSLAPLLSSLPLELRPDMETFIQACYEAGPHPVPVLLCVEWPVFKDIGLSRSLENHDIKL